MASPSPSPKKLSYAEFLARECIRASSQYGLLSDAALAYPGSAAETSHVRWPFLHPQSSTAFRHRLAQYPHLQKHTPTYFPVGTIVTLLNDDTRTPYIACAASVSCDDSTPTDVLYSLLPIMAEKRRVLRETRVHDCRVVYDQAGYTHWIGPFHLTLYFDPHFDTTLLCDGLRVFSADTALHLARTADTDVFQHLIHQPSIVVPVPLAVKTVTRHSLALQFMLVGVGPSSEFWLQSMSRGLVSRLAAVCDYPPLQSAMRLALHQIHTCKLNVFPEIACLAPAKVAIQEDDAFTRMQLEVRDATDVELSNARDNTWGVARTHDSATVRQVLTRFILPRERHIQRHSTTFNQAESVFALLSCVLRRCPVDVVCHVASFLVGIDVPRDIPHALPHVSWSSPFSRQPRHITQIQPQWEVMAREPTVAMSVLTGVAASVKNVITMMLGAIHHDRRGSWWLFGL